MKGDKDLCLFGPSERKVFECMQAPAQEYIKAEERVCMVSDTDNKSLFWVPSNMELNAIILQGGADTCKGTVSISHSYHSNMCVLHE